MLFLVSFLGPIVVKRLGVFYPVCEATKNSKSLLKKPARLISTEIQLPTSYSSLNFLGPCHLTWPLLAPKLIILLLNYCIFYALKCCFYCSLCRTRCEFNPLAPGVQKKIKIRNLNLNRLLIVEFVKKMVYLGAE